VVTGTLYSALKVKLVRCKLRTTALDLWRHPGEIPESYLLRLHATHTFGYVRIGGHSFFNRPKGLRGLTSRRRIWFSDNH
jgi:hypothetical protein